MITTFVLSQIFAGLTFVLGLTAYQIKSRKVTLLLLGLAQSSASIHFFLLGSDVGGFIFAISAARFLLGVWYTKSIIKYLFIFLTIVIGIAMFSEPYDILPIVGGVLGTLAAFCTVDRRMRELLLGGTVTTLLFNIALFSPVAILSGIFFLSSGLIGYWRFYTKKEK